MDTPSRGPARLRSRVPSAALLAASAVALALSALAAPSAEGQTLVRYLELEERLVRRQLGQELEAYRRARSQEGRARTALADAASSLDRALADEAPLERIVELEGRLDAARAEARRSAERAEALLDGLVERMRRLILVEEELARRRGGPAEVPDPLTGAWELRLEGGGVERGARTGLLDLELDGTRVTGTLGLEDGTFGSVRGTFVDGELELERVSARSGLDVILEGFLDPEDGGLSGTWRPAVAGRGNPPGGTWRAERSDATDDTTP